MLKEINSDKFREKSIKFKEGLNVVLGDENATNSIGKSTLLMVVDFVFGGNSFIDFNSDVVQELGDHDYRYCFSFGNKSFYFKRGTYRPDLVHVCNSAYEEIEPVTIDSYRNFLKTKYGILSPDVSFRSVASLFSRIWGKDNLNVRRPLHIVQNQSASESIELIIKIYSMYGEIKELAARLKEELSESSALKKAFEKNIVTKIKKTDYIKNVHIIKKTESEIDDIKNNIAKYACNINEIVNREILELKTNKDALLGQRLSVQSRLTRVNNNLQSGRYIKSKNMSGLKQFFPDINMERVQEVENFHSEITTILKNELQESARTLVAQLTIIDAEIARIDNKIKETLKSLENPTAIIDRVYDLANLLSEAKSQNEHFEHEAKLRESVAHIKSSLKSATNSTLKKIEDVVNAEIRRLVTKIYDEHRRCPVLTLNENNYKYEIYEDTGTGKAYSNLIVLDLSFFRTANIPFLIHDSLLFKNIENDAVSSMIKLYEASNKQSFIAIDEINKYGKETANTLETCAAIKLKDDKVLYTKDWRKKHN